MSSNWGPRPAGAWPYPSFLARMRLWLTILSYAEESTLAREQSATSTKVTGRSGFILVVISPLHSGGHTHTHTLLLCTAHGRRICERELLNSGSMSSTHPCRNHPPTIFHNITSQSHPHTPLAGQNPPPPPSTLRSRLSLPHIVSPVSFFTTVTSQSTRDTL